MPKLLSSILLILLMTVSCGRHNDNGVPNPQPAVYYWRTTLKLDSTERMFLHEHGVKKMYVRFFDVVLRDGKPAPNATLRFLDTVPQGIEVIPVIFIMENCLRSNMNDYARLLVQRVRHEEAKALLLVVLARLEHDITAVISAAFRRARRIRVGQIV